MSIFVVILFAVFGALWRRILGGWLNQRRSVIVALSPLILAPAWLYSGWLVFTIVSGLSLVFWTPGHDLGNDRKLLFRYGPIGLAWVLCRRWWKWSVPGWSEAAELFAGFFYYLIVNGAVVIWL